MNLPSLKVFIAFASLVISGPGLAEGNLLSAEELAAVIDNRVSELAPYQALLNDPDPDRSRAAMEIMLASGDSALVQAAIQFGFQASDTTLQRMSAKAVLDTGVPLTIELSGVPEDEAANFSERVRGYHKAAVSPDGVAYVSIAIGEFDPDKGCYKTQGNSTCIASLNADGIFITHGQLDARLGFGVGGALSGAAAIPNVDTPLVAELRLTE